MDDCTALVQTRLVAVNLHRWLLHNINNVFHPNSGPDFTRQALRREPISDKKLHQGDAAWATTGVVLGWLLDTCHGTLQLPPHRVDRLTLILKDILAHPTATCKQWHRLLGELRSMTFTIPGGEGLFSPLQVALQQACPANTVHICPTTQHCLQERLLFAQSLAARPTRITDLVPCPPHYVGVCDASREGMGGVWLPTSFATSATPFIWRYPFPPAGCDALVSFTNPSGAINNSELELAAAIVHEAALLSAPLVTHPITCCSSSNNTATVAWLHRASLASLGPSATLLHLRSWLRRAAHQLNASVISMPGIENVLANFASRAFRLSDSALLTHFASTSWQLLHPPPEIFSFMISTLLHSTLLPVLLLPKHDPLLACGKSGVNSVPLLMLFALAIDGAKYLPAALLQKHAKWRKPFMAKRNSSTVLLC